MSAAPADRRLQLNADPLGGGVLDEADIAETRERRRKAALAMSVSHMSDAKWQKLLDAVSGVHPDHPCLWKFVADSQPTEGSIPRPENVLEKCLDPSALGPPFYLLPEYRDIEWVEFCSWPNAPLDIAELLSLIGSLGQFETRETSTGLRLYGYSR